MRQSTQGGTQAIPLSDFRTTPEPWHDSPHTSSIPPKAGRPPGWPCACNASTRRGSPTLVGSHRTNEDGRTATPLLAGATIETGRYRLSFDIADYFRACGLKLADPPFLDVVHIDFGIADAGADYHVPLLVSPWSYSTYRGS